MVAAIYLINHTPSTLLNGKSPYKVLYGTSPTYNQIIVIGSLSYGHSSGKGGQVCK